MTGTSGHEGSLVAGTRWSVHEAVGHGATSVVCRASGPDGSGVAIKFASDPRFHNRLRREASLLAFLDHPNILRFHELVEFDHGPGMVVGLCPGGSLADALAGDRRLSASAVARLGHTAAAALAHLHSEGVVHHDISPANVLLDADGSPVLCDLGSASAPWVTPPLTVEGTRRFAAPEVRAGDAGTAPADVFSLAAVCLAALADDDAGSPELRSILESGTDPDPAARPSAAGMCRALSQVVAAERDSTVEFGPRPRTAPPPELSSSHDDRVPLLGGVALAIVVVIVALYLLMAA
ncbi:MAG: hypothetical protein JJLCMIEE_01937 [Acidimicrobiales bacterium]|nr:MAG: hypothetical protein EDR02_10285 [Actinomycetota bacterium]MBV6508870.1 hypothetical protein [Acidimicrobiales bacterium]RIK04998.1 MAG: hypothetical protein DCC48_11655 [Acidobacteriota bacterium]